MFGTKAAPTETPKAISDALERDEIVLIDVREPGEYASERIHGAMLFPLSTFDPAALPDPAGKDLVFHCGSGKRSQTAYERAVKAGVAVRSHMQGGIGAWKAQGLSTITVDPASGVIRDPH
ncbi:MAG: rhodanese-like domain-containing protein [Alphaproteobacteria bacterium]|nr:rhodanese-like domain-containing protein [Alphaproteobacteria bacterium]